MKKILSMLVMLMLALGLVACGGSNGSTGEGGATAGGSGPVDNSKEVYELHEEYVCGPANLYFEEDGTVRQEIWAMGATDSDYLERTGKYTVNKNTVECDFGTAKVTYMLKEYGLVNVSSNFCEYAEGAITNLKNPALISCARFIDFGTCTEPTLFAKSGSLKYLVDGGYIYAEFYEEYVGSSNLPKVNLEVTENIEYITNNARMGNVNFQNPDYNYSRYMTYSRIAEKNADIIKVLEAYVDYIDENKDTDIFAANAYYLQDGYSATVGYRYDEAIEDLAGLYLMQGDAAKCQATWGRANYGPRTYEGYEKNELMLTTHTGSGNTCVFDERGLLTEATDRGVTKHYVYDDQGRITMSYYVSGNDKTSMQYVYGEDGTVTELEYIIWPSSGGNMYSSMTYTITEKGTLGEQVSYSAREQGVPDWAANVPF